MNLKTVLVRMLKQRVSPSQFCRLINMRNLLSGRRSSRGYGVHRINARSGEIYRLTDHLGDYIYLCRKGRLTLYRHGIMERISRLAADYHLSSIEVRPNGVLIDCGANIGELGIWAKEQCLEYIPFEPESLEATCSDLNNTEICTQRYALWNETTTLSFYSMPEEASSSVFFTGEHHRLSTVEAVTLDSAIDTEYLAQVPGTIVLKVEAEGAEPEVLIGAKDTLAYVDYVTVDCGFERGVQRAHTFVAVFNILIDHGFQLQHMQPRRVTALFGRVTPKCG